MKLLLILPVRLYQIFLAPLVGPVCRYTPSCSHYFIESVDVHGPLRGPFLGIRRLLRCHPWGGWGHDPVKSLDHSNH